MFTFKVKLSRDRILIAGCALLAVLSLVWHFLTFSEISPKGKDTAARVEYLKTLGYSAMADSESHKPILLPAKFDEVYTSYNELQKEGGFDLSRHRGCEAELYTYNLSRFYELKEAMANLIVYRDKIIGGDISTLEKGGLCLPLLSVDENIKELKDKLND